MKNLNSAPVLLIAFNRPELVKRVFEQIRLAKPKKLFISVDGARNEEEWKKVNEVREIISNVDWPCKLYKRFPKENLGIVGGALGAIDWFFKNVEEGIILEDDSVPNQSFFKFCTEMLDKYKGDENIMQINGTNFQRGWKRDKFSYYFSKYPHTYGWATWRRAREKYDHEMKNYIFLRDKGYLRDVSPNIFERTYIQHIMDDAYYRVPEAVDTRWVYTVMVNNGLCITPNENLVTCIGFGEDSSHTGKLDSFLSLPNKEIASPIKDPPFKILDHYSDIRYSRWLFRNRLRKFILKKTGLYKLI